MEIRYSYASVPTIQQFSRSNAYIRGLMGPFGSGKSSGCVIELIRRAAAQKPWPDGIRRSCMAVIRNTYLQLIDTTLPVFQRWLPPERFGRYNSERHEYLIQAIPECEILVKFRALDRPEQVSNLLSSWYSMAWVNEAREVPWAVISALLGRVGRFTPQEYGGDAFPGVILDTNPPDVDSWWYHLFEEGRPPGSSGEQVPDAKLFKQPGGLSPGAENLPGLPPGYYENLARSMDARSKRVYVDGEYGFLTYGKPVYPEFRAELHLREDVAYKPGLPVYRGWDFGLTPACVMAQTVGGRISVIDELCADHMGADKFGDQVLVHCGAYKGRPFVDIGDPSGMDPSQADEKSCFEILQRKGINISGGGLPRTVTQSIELRTGAVRKGLTTLVDGRPCLVISPKAKRLVKGFNGAYQFRRMQIATDRYTESPDKGIYSHPHDALQYLMVYLLGDVLRGARGDDSLPPGWDEPYRLM